MVSIQGDFRNWYERWPSSQIWNKFPCNTNIVVINLSHEMEMNIAMWDENGKLHFLEWDLLLLLLLLMIWQSPGLPGWQKVIFITVTRRPHHPNIAAGLCCLATSPGFLPTLCEKWSGFFYTRDRWLKGEVRSWSNLTLEEIVKFSE